MPLGISIQINQESATGMRQVLTIDSTDLAQEAGIGFVSGTTSLVVKFISEIYAPVVLLVCFFGIIWPRAEHGPTSTE